MKFGVMMHLSPLNLMGKNLKFQKIEKSRYLCNHLADFDEIVHYETYLFSRAYQLFKKSNY